ncbi:hypothetical protein [Thalassoglobus polymorphus]|uniref:Uncharacterized protein n=1 Tax=Thalassoglobus polymorphus TaxID=2527994 RepID=A0A517QLB4_9PLAN|nr:hypothetical protein [Thalassoglobus polymorphus]QDT32416.1 hypothetical protein Mal48_16620 [Thalassoglobus polymorphus]
MINFSQLHGFAGSLGVGQGVASFLQIITEYGSALELVLANLHPTMTHTETLLVRYNPLGCSGLQLCGVFFEYLLRLSDSLILDYL